MKVVFSLCFGLLLIPHAGRARGEAIDGAADGFTQRVSEACGLPLKFDLSDYEYGSDEKYTYSNTGFEGCSLLAHSIVQACEKNPGNIQRLSSVKKVFCMRGSIGERKILQRKNGELVSLFEHSVSERGQDRSKLINRDLTRILKLDFEADTAGQKNRGRN